MLFFNHLEGYEEEMKTLRFLIGISLLILLFACTTVPVKTKAKLQNPFEAAQWNAANEMFKQDYHWQGADDAYSIKLDNNRVLWLFGDTLIARNDKIVSRFATDINMAKNSVGIQDGLNPSTAKIKYYWNKNSDSIEPKSFFESPYILSGNWLWPGDCAMLPDGKTLVIFFMNIKPTNTELNFDIVGCQVAIIRNSYDAPNKWNIEWIKNISENSYLNILIGSGGVLVDGNYIYAYGYSRNENIKGVTLARWPVKLFEQCDVDLINPQWWVGGGAQWINERELGRNMLPAILWDKQQTEFSVTKLASELFIMFQAYPQNGFIGNANLVYRVSRALTGPWSEQIVLYEKLFRDKLFPKDLMVYAGKYHPELTGADFIFTYATNTQNLKTLLESDDLYYPCFLKVDNKYFIEKLKMELVEIKVDKVDLPITDQ